MTVDDEFYDEVFDQLYEEAVPGVEEIRSTVYPEDANVPYLHYLDGDRMNEIIDEYLEEYDVPASMHKQVRFNVVLGKAPSTSLTNVDSTRTSHGLEPVSEMLRGKNREEPPAER